MGEQYPNLELSSFSRDIIKMMFQYKMFDGDIFKCKTCGRETKIGDKPKEPRQHYYCMIVCAGCREKLREDERKAYCDRREKQRYERYEMDRDMKKQYYEKRERERSERYESERQDKYKMAELDRQERARIAELDRRERLMTAKLDRQERKRSRMDKRYKNRVVLISASVATLGIGVAVGSLLAKR